MSMITDISHDWEFQMPGGDWQAVTLPHTAAIEPEVVQQAWEGVCNYRYQFFVPEEWQSKVVSLEIGGAMQMTRVYINEVYSFTHFGGYQRFFIPLNNTLEFGQKNCVRLELDNSPCDDMAPGKATEHLDFYYYSGLYRDARLHVCDRVHLSDELAVNITAGGGIFLRTELSDKSRATLSISCHVVNENSPFLRDHRNQVSLEAKIFAPDGASLKKLTGPTVELKSNGDHTFELKTNIDHPQTWHPDHPKLYRAEIKVFCDGIPCDSRTVRFGIRSIKFTREGFFLNGEKLDLRGTNRHMEYPFVGNAVPANAQRRDAMLIKQAGFNWVRLCHYNQHPEFIACCDELGLLVMAAIPGWQQFHGNEHFLNNTLRDCRELIRDLRNHPSVMLWEVSLNETYPPHWFNREMHRIAHEEYPGEGCYTCGDTFGNFEEWDVLFFHGKLKTDKPIIIREYGDWAFGGNESTSRQRRGNGPDALLQQAWNFQWTLNRAIVTPGVVGTADWLMIDYNRGYHPEIEYSGSMDIFRYPKYKYYFYQSQNFPEPMLFAVRGKDKIVVFSNCDEVELRENGKLPERRRPDSGPDSPYNPIGCSPDWETAMLWNADTTGGNPYDGGNAANLPHPPFTFTGKKEISGELEVIGFRNGIPVKKQKLLTPEDPARIEIRIRTEGVEVEVNDMVFTDVLVLDKNDTVVPVTIPVMITVTGAGTLIGGAANTEAGIASFLLRVHSRGLLKVSAEAQKMTATIEMNVTG